MIGQTVAHYEILAKLGEGGMGVVYKALDTKLHRAVALKFLPLDLTHDHEAIERFINEAQTASSLDHANLCTVHEINETAEGQLYIVMACYDGETLQAKPGAQLLPVEQVLDMSLQIARGLERAHEAGIIHRDLKPSNLIRTRHGEIKIIDFGLAKLAGHASLTQSGRTPGTVAYMSPEQLTQPNTVDHRTDIWSLGVVMYELLTGALPFRGEYEGTTVYAIVNETFLPLSEARPGMPHTIAAIVQRCLAKMPAQRYPTMREVIADLLHAQSELTLPSTGEEHKAERMLSAIMFTDMVGYSAIAQSNEELALALLAEHRRVLRPLFARFAGKEIEAVGDAFFVEFSSALQAGRCAIAIQQALHERNRTAAAEQQISVRIGVHLGDVVHTGEHVHGDGVNLAARLEPLAEPGGICLSEDMARQIQNKIALPLRRLGHGELKNISVPMAVYRIVLPWEQRSSFLFDRLNFAWRGRKKSLYRASVVGFALVVLLLIALQWRGEFVPSSLERNRIAVLPLANISPDPRDEYFAEGMTEELITTLARVQQFKVIARNSVMRYKGSTKDATAIGRELRAGTLLIGSVRKAGSHLRISVQLVAAEKQEPFWAQQYDRELQEVFTIQSDIARSVAEALRVKLLPSEQVRLEARATHNVEAYSLYLQGLFHWNKRTPSEIKQGLRHFQEAIAADSNYAQPYAGLADAFIVLGAAEYGNIPPQEARVFARLAAEKALRLNEQCAEAHAALANLLYTYEWDWQGAEREFARALALQPNYATVHHWYAHYLCSQARLAEARAEIELARELDPLSLITNTAFGMVLHYQRQPELAKAQLRKTLAMDSSFVPAWLQLGMVYASQQQFAEAIAAYEQTLRLAGDNPVSMSLLAHAYARAGRRERALELLQHGSPLFSAAHTALVYLGLGEKARALEWLERACDERSNYLIYLQVEPLVDSLRDEERFKALLRRVGLERS